MRRVVSDTEYRIASSRVGTTRLMRWAILMVCYAYKVRSEIESNIIKIAVNGE